MKKNALIVVTSHGQKGNTGEKTGWYLAEVTHIYYPLIEAGFQVDLASPKGGAAPMDESSRDRTDPDNARFLDDKELMSQMHNTIPMERIDSKKYTIIHFAGGHGTMWDFPNNKDIQRVVCEIYEQSGIVAAICHGPAALVNVTLSNGEYLVKGKDLSAFTDAEEAYVKMTHIVPFLLESTLRDRGAIMHSADIWNDRVVVSGHLITGQNPQSARSLGKGIVALAKTISLQKR